MIIEKENYDLVIGSEIKTRKTARYIFDGWSDEQRKKEFHNSLSFYASEVYGGRVAPAMPASKSIANIICWGSTVPKKGALSFGEAVRFFFFSIFSIVVLIFNLIFKRKTVSNSCRVVIDLSNSTNEYSEPPVGTVVDVAYNSTMTTIEKIEEFFKSSGLAVHRADPFYKPIKTIWQVIGEKMGGKSKK